MGVETAGFTWLREQTVDSAENLIVQIIKIKDAGYIEVEKKFSGNYPQTFCRITPVGRSRFIEYVGALKLS